MREFPKPQQESAAACENWDIRPFMKGPKQMTTFYVFHICTVLKEPISESYFERVPGPCKHEV